MSIEDEVKRAIDEFGDNAHKCFVYNCFGLTTACESNSKMLIMDDVKLKPLPELFSHDVMFYGDNAYLMWESLVDTVDDYAIITPESNDDFIQDIEFTDEIRRKTSAALPFDIERAKAGEAVYHITGGDIANLIIPDRQDYHPTGIVNGIGTTFYDISNLKMKYPPKKAKL